MVQINLTEKEIEDLIIALKDDIFYKSQESCTNEYDLQVKSYSNLLQKLKSNETKETLPVKHVCTEAKESISAQRIPAYLKEKVVEFNSFIEETYSNRPYSEERCIIYEHWLDLMNELMPVENAKEEEISLD